MGSVAVLAQARAKRPGLNAQIVPELRQLSCLLRHGIPLNFPLKYGYMGFSDNRDIWIKPG